VNATGARIVLAIAVVLLVVAIPVSAAPVPIFNPSFESPALPDGGSNVAITDWTTVGSGAFNPMAGVHYTGPGATDGVQVAYSNGGSISQVLGATLTANTLYALQVDVGDRLDAPFPGYTIGLFAGGNLLAQDSSSLAPNDGFLTSTTTYLASPGDASLGQSLEIRLSSPGIQVNFDNVRLDATAVAIPEPSSLALTAIGGLIGCGAAWRRRRRAD
jgi:hypothetical protein